MAGNLAHKVRTSQVHPWRRSIEASVSRAKARARFAVAPPPSAEPTPHRIEPSSREALELVGARILDAYREAGLAEGV